MKLSKNNLFIIIVLGFIGQLAWMLENMYLNVYLYNVLGGNSNDIATMVALSAISATITTLVMGSISDRLGKRKILVVAGYLIWGLSVLGFTFITQENISKIFPTFNVVSTTVWIMIIWDCVMTFLGSTANDAAFNAWITDVTIPNERGKIESILAVLPLIAMLVIFGLLDPFTQNGQWNIFFSVIGILVFVGGLLGLILMKDTSITKSEYSLKDTIVYGFKKETIKENKNLYTSFVLLLLISIATQIWMPYLIIYIQKTLGIENYALVLGVVLVMSSIISVLVGRLIDKYGKIKWIPIGFVIQVLGLISMYIVKGIVPLMIVGIILMSGNMILTAISNGLVRDYTPLSMSGRFQGVRMIFGVMLPMIIGPFIGSTIIGNSNLTYEELGVIKQIPTSLIFLASIIVLLFVFIPYKVLNRSNYDK